MRIVGEVPHPTYKITILHHMNRFTLQVEADAISQSYILRESDDITSAQDVIDLVNGDFIRKLDKVFLDMGDNLIHLLAGQGSENENNEGKIIEGII